MKAVYIIGPLIGLAAFSGYYGYWTATAPEREPQDGIESTWHLKQYERRDGEKEAAADLQGGVRRLKTGGCVVAPWVVEFRVICAERFGIKTDAIHGPWTTEATDRYVSGYNRVVWRYISSKYHISEEDLWIEAENRFRLRHPGFAKSRDQADNRSDIEGGPNQQRSEGTPGKSSPSNSNQSPGTPHP